MKTKKLLFLILMSFSGITGAIAQTPWYLSGGNTGTSTTYLGTTNANDLMFKVDSQNAGYIGRTSTAIGYWSMNAAPVNNFSTSTGPNILNTAIGFASLFSMNGSTTSQASNNTAVGAYCLTYNVSGNNNTAIGELSGRLNTGSGNIFIGHAAGESFTGSDKLYIDNYNTSSPIIWGDLDPNHRDLKFNVAANSSSRVTINSGGTNTSGLKFEDLTSSYSAPANTSGKFLTVDSNGDVVLETMSCCESGRPAGEDFPRDEKYKAKAIDNSLEIIQSLEGKTFMEGTALVHSGFVFHELAQVLPHIATTADYKEIIPYLVEAIKTQQIQINDLQSRLSENFKMQNIDLIEYKNTMIIGVSPNPSQDEMNVSLNIEKDVKSAMLRVHDLQGTMLSSLSIHERGANISKTFQKDNFGTGIYIVSLVVNGKAVDSKKIVFN